MTDNKRPHTWRVVERGQPETCDHHPGLRRPDNGDCLACPAPNVLVPEDVPAAYAAARAGAARSLRAVEAEAAELGIDLVAELAGWQAEQFERWTPFTAMADSVFRPHHAPPEIPGACYEASFGRVHVRPGCRCAR